MSRKPKPKNELSAGQRVALYLEEQRSRMRKVESDTDANVSAASLSDSDVDGRKRAMRRETTEGQSLLPRPNQATVRIDLGSDTAPPKRLGGMCNGPVSCDANISGLFRDMRVPHVRNSGWDTRYTKHAFLVSCIFPNENADDTDPSSYDFSLTDKYIMSIYNCSAECIYSFSDSDTDSSFCFRDPEKWVRVCLYIIRHYNNYWANGYAFDIRCFELSPPPDAYERHGKDNVHKLYERLARAIKLADESYKIGGLSFDAYCDYGRDLLKLCSAKKIPLDFISMTYFGDSVIQLSEVCEKYEAMILNLGLSDTYIMVSAWNYMKEVSDKYTPRAIAENADGMHSVESKRLFESQADIEGSSFCASVLLSLDGIDRVKQAFYYDAQPSVSKYCGICDRYGNAQKPYYAFCAYSDIAGMPSGVMCVSEQYPRMRHTGIWARGGKNERGEAVVMISSFDGVGNVDVRLENIPDGVFNADIYMSDGVKNAMLCDSVALSGSKKRLLFNLSAYGYLIIKIH